LALVASYAAGAWWLWAGQSDATQLFFVSWFAPSRFVEFVVGVFLGRFYLTVKSAPPALSSLAQVLGVALIVTGAVYRADAPWPLWGGLLYVPGSVLLVLGLAYGGGLFARHLGHPVLRELGGASFSLYLLHAPILRGVKGVCLYLGWEVQSWVGFLAVAVGMLVALQSLASVVYHWYELPVQRRLRRWLRASSVQSASYAPQFEA
jgi:peptidoglycan/LPS O-acetylase OafA/YrhL